MKKIGCTGIGGKRTEELWDSLLELDYLEATREAIIETLEAL